VTSFSNAVQLMLYGTPASGKTAITQFLIHHGLQKPLPKEAPLPKPMLVIDAAASQCLSNVFCTPEQLAEGEATLSKGVLATLLRKVQANPEANSQWLDALMSSTPLPLNERLEWLRLGADWQEPDTITAGRLAFSLRRFVRKTYSLVLIDGYSHFLLETFKEEGLQPVLVASPEALPSLTVDPLALEEAPAAILLTQTGTGSLNEATKHWLNRYQRCPLLGRLEGLPELNNLSPTEEQRLHNCFLRLDVAGLL
jgi:hypothetical protein